MFRGVFFKHFADGWEIFGCERLEYGFAVQRSEFVYMISLSAEFLALKSRNFACGVDVIAPFALVIEHYVFKKRVCLYPFEDFFGNAVKFKRQIVFADVA